MEPSKSLPRQPTLTRHGTWYYWISVSSGQNRQARQKTRNAGLPCARNYYGVTENLLTSRTKNLHPIHIENQQPSYMSPQQTSPGTAHLPKRIKFRTPLRSDITNAWFRARFIIEWALLPEGGSHNISYLEAIIRSRVHNRSGKITAQWSPIQVRAAQDAVNVDLRNLADDELHSAIRINSVVARLRVSRNLIRAIRKEEARHIPQTTGKRAAQLAEIASLHVLRDEILASPDLGLVWWLRSRCGGSSSLTEDEFRHATELINLTCVGKTGPASTGEILDEVLQDIDQDKQIHFFRHMRSVLEMIDQTPAAERLAAALAKHEIPIHPSRAQLPA